MIIKGRIIGIDKEKGTAVLLNENEQYSAAQYIVSNDLNCNIGDTVVADIKDKLPVIALIVAYLFPLLAAIGAIWVYTTFEGSEKFVYSLSILIISILFFVLVHNVKRILKARNSGKITQLISMEDAE